MKIPNYKILKKLGEGGMGTVYLAEHELIKRKVAIKVLHKHLVSNEDFITRFRREAELLATLDHQNIVRLNEYFEHEGSLFLIMEYVDGQELDQYINNVSGPIIEEELVPMFKQILSAMGYAHKKGLVHRDIKPANILISQEGTIKILDFGIAKLVTDDIGLTKSGVQVGTVTYMSPEQVNAEEVDKLTDIYSLGVTLYQMAVGQSPYKNTTSFKTQMKIVQNPFPKAQDIYPGVSDKIENIINKATQKKKTDRYQSCEEFIQSLNSDSVSAVINNINEEKSTEKTKPYKKKEKRKVSLSLILLFLGLVLFGITYLILNSKNNTIETDIIQKNLCSITGEECLEDNSCCVQVIVSDLVIDSLDILTPIFDKVSLEKKRNKFECIYGNCQNGYGVQAYWGWKYVGEFKQGKNEGKGYVENQSGGFTEGEGEWFPMSGYFKTTNSDGDIYEGEYWNGYKHGKGKLTYADGTIKEGRWEKDKFITSTNADIENKEKEKNIVVKQKEKVKVESIHDKSIHDLRYESSKYFNNSQVTSKGKQIIINFLNSKNRSSIFMDKDGISKVLIVDNKFLVLLSGYKKPYCYIFDINNKREKLSKQLMGAPVSFSYCKSNKVLCSDQEYGITYKKNYIFFDKFTKYHSWKKYKGLYGSCNLEKVNLYYWK